MSMFTANELALIESEGDRCEFESHGLLCIVNRVSSSLHWCGYVRVTEGHPLFGVEYGQEHESLSGMLESVHVGPTSGPGLMLACLTGEVRATPELALTVHGGITYSARCISGRNVAGEWWFGFDCAHSGDKVAHTAVGGDVYRDLEYVKAEAQSLAAQLAQLGGDT